MQGHVTGGAGLVGSQAAARRMWDGAEVHTQQKSATMPDRSVLGVVDTPDIGDTRESPALDTIALLKQAGADVSYHDPYVPEIELPAELMQSVGLNGKRAAADSVVIATDHKPVNSSVFER